MRQLLYVSTSLVGTDWVQLDDILAKSRKRNGLYGVTGLLWTDGLCFVQVLEGSQEVVADTLERIVRDPRHHGIQIAIDREVNVREFGRWSMVQAATNDRLSRDYGPRAVAVLRQVRSTLVNTIADVIARSYPPSISVVG